MSEAGDPAPNPTRPDAPPDAPPAAPPPAADPKRRAPSSALRRAAQVVLGVAVGLGVAELAFSLRDGRAFPHLNVYTPDPALGVRLTPGATERISFSGNPVTSVRINADGFRGADLPPPSENETLVVGDSQVFGLGVEENETFCARLEEEIGGGAKVINAGVPTYGPLEYARVIEEVFAKRKPKTVIYTVNFVNDPFEAGRPNTERHAVWDGWAVRTETAPAKVTAFPGREILFQKSHAFFALRQWLYKTTGPERDDRGFASEGTWRDLVKLAGAAAEEKTAAAAETERLNALRDAELKYASESARAAELRVKLLAFKELKLDNTESGGVYLAAGANPGDIVVPQLGEEGRPLAASAEYVRQAAVLRAKFEQELKKRAEEAADKAAGKEILRSIEERDALEKSLRELNASPVALIRAVSPLAREVERAKALVESKGARFVLLILPIDVQVSAEEWKKYGTAAIDMEPTKLLLTDLVETARHLEAPVLDATEALAQAEPGAFLYGDIHMTPKGHKAVAAALAKTLKDPAKPLRTAPALALPIGRSRVPPRHVWATMTEVNVSGSTAAGCETKRIREWLYVRCLPQKGAGAPAGVVVQKGGHGDAMTMANGGAVTLLAPIVKGDLFEATFVWADKARKLVVDFMKDEVEPDMGFVDAAPVAAPPADAGLAGALCACHKEATKQDACADLVAAPDADCAATYSGDCAKLLDCAAGHPVRAPKCPPGSINAGALLHCHKLCEGDGQCGAQERCVEKQGAKLCVPEAGSAPGAATGAGAAGASASASATPEDLQAFNKLAKDVLDSAQEIVTRCRLTAEELGEWFDQDIYDTCTWKEGDVPGFTKRVDALRSFSEAHPAVLKAERASFAAHVRLFGDWVALSARTGATRGTLELYQKLAGAWNALSPQAAVPVDPPSVLAQYFEKMDDAHDHYIASSNRWYEERKKRGTPLPWRRGMNGPRLYH